MSGINSSDLSSFSKSFQSLEYKVAVSSQAVEVHSKILEALVSGTRNCPSLFILYPKKMSIGYRIKNISKTLFQDVMMLSVVCPETLKMVECGPDGAGWEVTNPKYWVKKWGPALLCALRVFQVAVNAGRLLGFPIPSISSADDIGFNQGEVLGALRALFNTYAEEGLFDGLLLTKDSLDSCSIPDDNIVGVDNSNISKIIKLSGEAYECVQLFLTTGDNLHLGDLHVQLQGKMERIYGEDGSMDWVSVEGKPSWLNKHSVRIKLNQDENALVLMQNSKAQILQGVEPSHLSIVSTNDCLDEFDSKNNKFDQWIRDKLLDKKMTTQDADLCVEILNRHGFTDIETTSAIESTDIETFLSDPDFVGLVGVKIKLRSVLRDISQNTRSAIQEPEQLSTAGIDVQVLMNKVSELEAMIASKAGLDEVATKAEVNRVRADLNKLKPQAAGGSQMLKDKDGDELLSTKELLMNTMTSLDRRIGRVEMHATITSEAVMVLQEDMTGLRKT